MMKTITSISVADQMENEFLHMTPQKTIMGEIDLPVVMEKSKESFNE